MNRQKCWSRRIKTCRKSNRILRLEIIRQRWQRMRLYRSCRVRISNLFIRISRLSRRFLDLGNFKVRTFRKKLKLNKVNLSHSHRSCKYNQSLIILNKGRESSKVLEQGLNLLWTRIKTLQNEFLSRKISTIRACNSRMIRMDQLQAGARTV